MDTKNASIQTGKIQRGEIRLSSFGESLQQKYRLRQIDISVIREDGPFDQGPWIELK